MRRALIGLAILVSSCGQPHFTRSDGTGLDLARDRYACEVQAQQLAEPPGGETAIGPAIATTIAKHRVLQRLHGCQGMDAGVAGPWGVKAAGTPRRSGLRRYIGRLTVSSGLMVTTACTYSVARLDYRGHPELRAVRLWASRRDAAVPNLGPVEASRGGWTDCDGMATGATLDLLEEARVRGGDGVIATRYQNLAHWAGRPRCRRNWVLLGHMTVCAIGLAAKGAPSLPSEPAP